MKVVVSEFREGLEDMKVGDVAIASDYKEWHVVVKNLLGHVITLDGKKLLDGVDWTVRILDPNEWEICVRRKK